MYPPTQRCHHVKHKAIHLPEKGPCQVCASVVMPENFNEIFVVTIGLDQYTKIVKVRINFYEISVWTYM